MREGHGKQIEIKNLETYHYVGEFKNGKYHGYGTLKCIEKEFTGYFVNG